jgi:hypothetical protein
VTLLERASYPDSSVRQHARLSGREAPEGAPIAVMRATTPYYLYAFAAPALLVVTTVRAVIDQSLPGPRVVALAILTIWTVGALVMISLSAHLYADRLEYRNGFRSGQIRVDQIQRCEIERPRGVRKRAGFIVVSHDESKTELYASQFSRKRRGNFYEALLRQIEQSPSTN